MNTTYIWRAYLPETPWPRARNPTLLACIPLRSWCWSTRSRSLLWFRSLLSAVATSLLPGITVFHFVAVCFLSTVSGFVCLEKSVSKTSVLFRIIQLLIFVSTWEKRSYLKFIVSEWIIRISMEFKYVWYNFFRWFWGGNRRSRERVRVAACQVTAREWAGSREHNTHRPSSTESGWKLTPHRDWQKSGNMTFEFLQWRL